MGIKPQNSPTRWTLGAWLVLGVAVLLFILPIALISYRATLPTDGWSVYTTEIETANWLYDLNLVGASSELKSGDRLLAVDDRSVSGTASHIFTEPPRDWQVGQSVVLRVQRDGALLDIPVPVVNWTWLSFWRFNFTSLEKATESLGTLVLLGLGWFTFLRRPNVPSARALLILTSTIAATSLSRSLPDGLSMQFNLLAFYLTSFFSYVIFGTLLAPSLLVFTLLFPNPKQIVLRHPWLILLPYVYGLFLLIVLYVGFSAEIGWYSTLAFFVMSIVSLIHSALTQQDTASRAQLQWAIGGFLAGLLLFMLNFPVAFGLINDPLLFRLVNAVANLGFVVIGGCLAIAILRYRLYDIDVIIRKTLVYGVLSGLLIMVYFVSVILMQSVFELMTGAQSPIAIVISTLIIAGLFAPLCRSVQILIDRRFFRNKFDAQQVLAHFSRTVREETDTELLSGELARVVQETLQPQAVSIWLNVKLRD